MSIQDIITHHKEKCFRCGELVIKENDICKCSNCGFEWGTLFIKRIPVEPLSISICLAFSLSKFFKYIHPVLTI